MSTIPVIIDSVKKAERFEMTRCSYFSIQCDEPCIGWTTAVEKKRIPMILMGLAGVIHRPLGRKTQFRRPDDFDALFDLIETNDDLYVDTNDIWLPNFVFEDKFHSRGKLFRVGFDLFRLAHQYREGKLVESKFLSDCKKSKKQVNFSPRESKAFAVFEAFHLNEAKEHYRRNPKLQLLKQKVK